MIVNFDTLNTMWREKLVNYVLSSYTITGVKNPIDERYIKRCAIGNCAIFRNGDKIISLPYNTRNEPNYQLYPVGIICTNPYLKPSTFNLTIGVDCELLYYFPTDRNIENKSSLMKNIINTTAEQLTIIDMSIAVCAENTRYNVAICAGDDNDKTSIEAALIKMKRGEMPCFTSNELISSGIRSIDLTGKHEIRLSDLTELKQNIIAAFLQTIGYSVQNNFKREYVQGGEMERNDDIANISGNIIFDNISMCIDNINSVLNLKWGVIKNDNMRVREITRKPFN